MFMNATLVLLVMQLLKPMPTDFAVSYNYVAGSMPPPHHYEFLFIVNASGEGKLQFWPDYSATPVWKDSMKIEIEKLTGFYNFLVEQKFFRKKWQEVKDRPVGGGHVYLKITADGKDYSIPPYPVDETMAELIRNAAYKLIPENAMKQMYEKHEVFKDNYKNGE